jgi:hypothetical protein
MRWVLGLVGAGIDGQSLSFNIMEFDRPDCLDDIGNVGLTLPEGKLLLARVFSRRSLLRNSTATRCYGQTVVSATGGAM